MNMEVRVRFLIGSACETAAACVCSLSFVFGRPLWRCASATRQAPLERATGGGGSCGGSTPPPFSPPPCFGQASLFCGRLPKGFSLPALIAAASSPPPSSGVRYLPVLGSSHSRATCVFLEFADAAAVACASSYMNGSLFYGAHIIAVPACTLS